MVDEHERDDKAEIQRFKMRMMAAHPENSKAIMELFDQIENGANAPGGTTHLEVQRHRGPLSVEEKQFILNEFKAFGIGV